MPEMQKAISNLRILLASIQRKEEELTQLKRQFQRQLNRAPGYAIHGGNSLESALSIMEEIRERLDDNERTLSNLMAIKKRGQDELQALMLTDKIEQAKVELANLRAQDNLDKGRIDELMKFIDEASAWAGQAITGDNEEVPNL
jgi:chromosome segregation ATPase